MRKLLTSLCLLLIITCLFPLSARAQVPRPEDILGEAALLMDAETGQVLYEKNAFEKMQPASITKIMTAMLALEYLDPQSTVTASSTAVSIPSWGSSAYIQAGERLTVEQAMYAMMLRSANEAANILGEEVAGSLGEFAGLMNRRALELGAKGTNFTNTNGLPARDHVTTAYDMALITRQALQTPGFLAYFGADTYSMPPTNLADTRIFTNTHRMLLSDYGVFSEDVIGGKTGYTASAGYTLVTAAQRDGRTLICVILNSTSYYTDTQALLDFGFNEFFLYTYEFVSSDPEEISIWDDGREAGRAYFHHPESVSLLLHDSVMLSDVREGLDLPDQLEWGQIAEGNALLRIEGGAAEGLPETLLSVPMQVDVATFDPPVVNAMAQPSNDNGFGLLRTELGQVGIALGAVLLAALLTVLLASKLKKGNARRHSAKIFR